MSLGSPFNQWDCHHPIQIINMRAHTYTYSHTHTQRNLHSQVITSVARMNRPLFKNYSGDKSWFVSHDGSTLCRAGPPVAQLKVQVTSNTADEKERRWSLESSGGLLSALSTLCPFQWREQDGTRPSVCKECLHKKFFKKTEERNRCVATSGLILKKWKTVHMWNDMHWKSTSTQKQAYLLNPHV